MRRRLHKVKSRRRLRPGSHLIHLRPRELSSPADGPPLLRFAVYSDTHYWVRSSTRSAWMRRVAAAPVRDGLVVDAAEEVLPLLLRQLSAFAASGADFAVHAGDAVCGGSSFQQAGRCTPPCLEMGHHSPPHSAGGEATPPPLPDPCPTSPAGGRRVRDDASAVPLARGLRTRHEPGPDHRPARALHDPSPRPFPQARAGRSTTCQATTTSTLRGGGRAHGARPCAPTRPESATRRSPGDSSPGGTLAMRPSTRGPSTERSAPAPGGCCSLTPPTVSTATRTAAATSAPRS